MRQVKRWKWVNHKMEEMSEMDEDGDKNEPPSP